MERSMKKAKNDLRRQAEAKLSGRKDKSQPSNQADTLRLLHELEVHQIELEMQNEELIQARAEAEEAYRQYTDLYDFAPVGYLTLARDGTIRQVNLAGANLLGAERGKRVKHRLEFFVAVGYRPAFNIFFEKLLSGQGRETCELPFWKNENELTWAYLEATCFENGHESRAVVVDITKRKRIEHELQQVKKGLEATNTELQAALAREQKLANTDVLTGIHNRRSLFELARHEFDIAARYHQPLSVIMFDIDHFKEVNDIFGHAVGDQILQLVAQAACEELRSADMIGRYGGEEFVIILPMTNAQQAYLLAERIRMAVAAMRVPTESGEASVKLSIGISEMHGNVQTSSVEDLFRRADKSMYAAKLAGRNRTEVEE
jgi:diguanylate cyclase (GGDEF)-like protein/PAS domain S-box-containing protein